MIPKFPRFHRLFLLIGILTFFFHGPSDAQVIENAGDYMTEISSARSEMNGKYLAYISAAAHSRHTRKVEKLRTQTLESIRTARTVTLALPKYKGDNSLREASIEYIRLCYQVFNEDYSRIVNMEETAEHSVAQMESYLLLEEQTSSKLQEASENLSAMEKAFAAKYGVILVEVKDELSDKMSSAGTINRYCDRLYMLFFKCNWEDAQLFKALNSRDATAAEQACAALTGFAQDGLAALNADSLKNFKGYSGLANGCRHALEFYFRMANRDIPKLIAFCRKQEQFDQLKKSLAAKGSKKTQQDVDEYNRAVKDLNAGINDFNQLNQDLNKERQQVAEDWEASERSFKDDLIPVFK